jgi:hypothetical protein
VLSVDWLLTGRNHSESIAYHYREATMSTDCWPEMCVRREFQLPEGHLVIVESAEGARPAFTTNMAEHNAMPALIYLTPGPADWNIEVLGQQDQVTFLDYGTGWSIRASTDCQDIAFPKANGYPIGSLVIGEKGPIAIALLANSNQRVYYLLETGTVVNRDPYGRAAVRKWSVELPSKSGHHTVASVSAK